MKKALILLSGGLDSTTCLAIAKSQGYECHALSFNYQQKHKVELEAAKKITQHFGVKSHTILDLPTTSFQGSALTEAAITIPLTQGAGSEIPTTYVPARNTVFLSFALGLAETLEAFEIFIGVSYVDYSGYVDCRPEYIAAFQNLANLATKAGVEGKITTIKSPLLYLSKAETVRLGHQLGVDYSMTVSCYQADTQGRACGQCDSCYYRKKGFNEAGLNDPTIYIATTKQKCPI
jgi:7-cyano-7-deazaguanine synthase